MNNALSLIIFERGLCSSMMKGRTGEGGGRFKNNNQPESLAARGRVDVAIAVPIRRLGRARR